MRINTENMNCAGWALVGLAAFLTLPLLSYDPLYYVIVAPICVFAAFSVGGGKISP